MISLSDFNAERYADMADLNSNAPRLNGIACPSCGEEMLDSAPGVTLTSSPPQKNVHCGKCDYRGYRVA